MNTRHPIDPDEPERSQTTAGEIAGQLVPIEPPVSHRLDMRERLSARVRAARESARSVTFVRANASNFRTLMRGVRVMNLSTTHRAVLLEFSAGASLPTHRHQEDEECVVIRGSAQVHDTQVRAGDYHLAQARSRHAVVRSDHGALLFVRGTPIGSFAGVLRDLATAWLPDRAATHLTLHADEGHWRELAPGVTGRVLCERAGFRSLMIRLEAGAHYPSMRLGWPTESIVVRGEAYFGDERVGPGDYETFSSRDLAPEMGSDTGAMLFLRLAARSPGG